MNIPAPFQKLNTYFRSLMPGLSEDNWAICEGVLRVRTVPKGEYLVQQGNVCNYVSFINHGLLRMYYLVDGKERINEFFKEGEYCSDYRSFLLREPSATSIRAIEDTEVVDISFNDLQNLYKQIPEANIIGRLVAEELFIDICRRTTCEVNADAATRYDNLIAESPWLLQRVPQYMIASYLGITPEALSRIKARTSKKQIKPVLVN